MPASLAGHQFPSNFFVLIIIISAQDRICCEIFSGRAAEN